MPSEYTEFYNAYRNTICPKILGISTVSKQTLESRIRTLMSKAIATNNRELAQVACDMAADVISPSSNLLSEMDSHWKKIDTDEPEDVQRTAALKELRQ